MLITKESVELARVKVPVWSFAVMLTERVAAKASIGTFTNRIVARTRVAIGLAILVLAKAFMKLM